jgi:large subunit ribosomal protein L6
MSRIGNAPVTVPAGVTIDISSDNLVKVKGPKGELMQQVDPAIKVEVEDGTLTVSRPDDSKRNRSMHGLYRALIANMVTGVTEGYTISLEAVGVGYRASNTGNLLELSLGYSHPIHFYIPDEIKVDTVTDKGKAPRIDLSGIDKQLLGHIAAKIRSFRKPEPYKGKGVRFLGENIRRKAGKTASK